MHIMNVGIDFFPVDDGNVVSFQVITLEPIIVAKEYFEPLVGLELYGIKVAQFWYETDRFGGKIKQAQQTQTTFYEVTRTAIIEALQKQKKDTSLWDKIHVDTAVVITDACELL